MKTPSPNKIELTSIELEKIKQEVKSEAFKLGIEYGRSQPFKYDRDTSLSAIRLVEALVDFMDNRYQRIEEDY